MKSTPLVISFAMLLTSVSALRGNWPQFRGPGGLGLAAEDARPPVHFGPQTNVAWRVGSPAGNSSPVIWGRRIFITGFTAGKLLTLAYDRDSGRELWRREVAPEKIEDVHPSLGNPATATPATDGERLYVHFGSFGALAYDFEKPLPDPIPLKIEFPTSNRVSYQSDPIPLKIEFPTSKINPSLSNTVCFR